MLVVTSIVMATSKTGFLASHCLKTNVINVDQQYVYLFRK